MPDIPNPFSLVSDSLSEWVNSAYQKAWDIAVEILRVGIYCLDYLVSPNLQYNGPLSGVYPLMFGLGVTLAAVLALVQIGQAILTGPKGFARLFAGVAQYVVITAGFVFAATLMVKVADTATAAILHEGLGIDSWQGLSEKNSNWQNLGHLVSGPAAVFGLLFLIPAGIFFVLEGAIRAGAIYILAATVPLVAAGLVNDATRSWFWKTLRWFMALAFMTPITALAVTIGFKILAGGAGATATGSDSSTVQQLAQVALGGCLMLIAATAPMALFKLFAFVDPNTAAGASARSFFSGAGSSGASSVDDSADGVVGSSPGAGSTSGSNGSAVTVAADQEAEKTESAWMSKAKQISPAIGGALAAGAGFGQKAGAMASGMMDAAGAGNYMRVDTGSGGAGTKSPNTSSSSGSNPDSSGGTDPTSTGSGGGDAAGPGPAMPDPATPTAPLPQAVPAGPGPAGGDRAAAAKAPTTGGAGGAGGGGAAGGAAGGAIGGDAAIAAAAL